MARPITKPEELHKESRSLWNAIRGESPLACALTCAAFLDKALISLLFNFFIKNETPENILDEQKGSLSDLFRRANAAYCCGLITSNMLGNLLLIARIRNQFAHNHKPIDFTDKTVNELCCLLKLPNISKEISIGGDPKPIDLHDNRSKFSIICLFMFNTILHAAINTEHLPKVSNPMW